MFLRILLLSVFSCAPAVAFAAPTWSAINGGTWQPETKVNNDAGEVTIESRTIDQVLCYRGTTTVSGLTPDQLYTVVSDIVGTKKWSTAGVYEAEVLGKSGSNIEYYQYLDVPGWTLANDRFWFLKGTTERAGDSIVFRWEKLDNGGSYSARYAKVKTDYPKAVEPPINTGGWLLKTTPAGLHVSYSICTDTGGSIPAGIQKMATRGTLPDTMRDAIVEAKRRAGK